jgi:glycosyltransferase involved in cell wall biosynthesis
MSNGLHVGLAGPITVRDLLPWLPASAQQPGWQSNGSPLLTTLLGNLRERGVRLSIFTSDEALERQSEPWLKYSGDALTLYVTPRRRRGWRFANGRPGRMLDFFAFERQCLEAAMADARPDIVNAHWSYEFAAAALASGLPTLVTCHDAPWVILRHMPDAYRVFRLLLARSVLSRSRQLTVVSPYLVAPIARMTPGKIRLIPNPTARWVFQMHPQAARAVPPAGGPLRLGMLLNGWIPRKNPEPAMQAMALIARQHPQARMHLLGPGYDANGPAFEWATRHGLAGLFVFHGAVPHRDAMRILDGMEMLVHPAVEESFGLSIAEAMALGLPVVGGASSGAVPWVVGEGGLLVDVRSPDAIAAAVLRLAADAELYGRCSLAGLQRSRTCFSEESVTEEYLSAYRAVLADTFGASQSRAGMPA